MIAQTQPESILHWFYTNAPAAWITAIVAVVTVAVTQLRRHRPKRLLVREQPTISFLSIGPALRERLTITFDGTRINDLSMIGYEAYNEGSDPIQNAAFTIALPATTIVLSAAVSPHECKPKCELGHTPNLINVSIPYLNSHREHKHLLHFLVLVDGETRPAKVRGSGDGWSVRYSPLPGRRQMRQLLVVPLGVGMLTGLVSVFYMRYALRVFKIGPPQIAGKMLFAAIPLMALFGASILLIRALAKNLGARTLTPLRPQDKDRD